ncbi:hypothetical protein [Nesterenkonia pannonica]|uniref:hypothetical protein n=1 Tax=Nesterenkonia pannonica TaxID=1548602 RepID=UPI002164B356|nr:hypothetical protein [Nesterenkonia pannonica]
MQAEHWVAIIVASIALIGTLAGVFFGKKPGTPSLERRDRENYLVDTTHTPASPGTEGQSTALDLAHYAVTEARAVAARMDAMESRLNRWQKAHEALFGWARWIEADWHDLRLQDRPPPIPPEAHHPE